MGGFPGALQDFLTGSRVQEGTIRLLWDVVAGDLDRWGRDRLSGLKLLERTVRSLGSAVSWRTVAQDMGVASPETARDYVTLLAESFVLLVLYFWDRGGDGISLRKNKKVYFTDPLFAAVPRILEPGVREPDLAALVENVVAMALYRSEEREPVESFSLPRSLFYWRSHGDREVDFLVGTGTQKVPRPYYPGGSFPLVTAHGGIAPSAPGG